MIRTIRHGFYKLIESKNHTKLLQLDKDLYAWLRLANYGEMLVVSHRNHPVGSLLSTGRYNLYTVDEEPEVADHIHLELEAGLGKWQGYLLLTGLPNDHKIRSRIIPTHEIITGGDVHKYYEDPASNLAKSLINA